MGYHIILTLEASIKEKYIDFINCRFDHDEIREKNNAEYMTLYDEWTKIGLGTHFNEYEIDSENNFKLKMTIKPYDHSGNLEEDYILFVKNVIVPISDVITHCETEHDDYGRGWTHYSDDELREIRYIKAIKLPEIQYTKRLPSEKPEVIDKIAIYPSIYNSDENTWPSELRNWWYHIRDAKKLASDLRKHYSEDEELLKIADWFDKYTANDLRIRFEYN